MQTHIAKLEAIIPTLATREDLAKLEVGMHREISAVHREVSSLHKEIGRVHETIAALMWKMVSTIIATSTALVSATYFLATRT
jgi:uncharacterized coiled-coil DUF342 family protein